MRKLPGLLLVVTLAFTATCGGSDDKSDNALDSSDTTAALSGRGEGNFSDMCAARAAFSAPSPTGASADMKTAVQNLERAKQTAPSEIKADVAIVVDAAKPFFDLLASVNYDYMKLANDPSKQQQLQTLGAKFQEEKVKAASDRIEAWAKAHCS
jgi:hypothetical protein